MQALSGCAAPSNRLGSSQSGVRCPVDGCLLDSDGALRLCVWERGSLR